MALKISTAPIATAAPADPRTRVDAAISRASAAVAAGDLDTLRALHAEIDGWDDEHRRHQAELALVEVATSSGDAAPGEWIARYALAAERLATVLEPRPAEPVLLN